MKLLITGGCGFLGSNLAADAMSRGDEVIVFDNLLRPGSIKNLDWLKKQGEFDFHYGDIRNRNDVDRLISAVKPDAVFHLAGQVAMTTSIKNPRLDFETNALGTHNLLEAIRSFAKDAIVVYSSTNKVYGDLEQFEYMESSTRYTCKDKPFGFDERVQLDFHSPYGCSKGAADQLMLDYSRIFGLNTIVFRHSSMYGGRQFSSYDQGWIGWFCSKAIEQKNGILVEPFTISGNGKQVRDVLHVDDMKRLYESALRNGIHAKGKAFNIGGGVENSLSLLELFEVLETSMDLKLNYTVLPVRESDQKVFIADNTEANNVFAWSPRVSAKEGIGKMIDWVTEFTLSVEQ